MGSSAVVVEQAGDSDVHADTHNLTANVNPYAYSDPNTHAHTNIHSYANTHPHIYTHTDTHAD